MIYGLVLLFLVKISMSKSNLEQLDLLSAPSQAALSPFLINNPDISSALFRKEILNLQKKFLPLFSYILGDPAVSSILLQRANATIGLSWVRSMSQQDLRTFLSILLTKSQQIFYHMMVDSYYFMNQQQCQQYFRAILGTGHSVAIQKVLTPVAGEYFWNKRCILTQDSTLTTIADTKVKVLTLAQKMSLVPVIIRMNVVHSLIFNVL